MNDEEMAKVRNELDRLRNLIEARDDDSTIASCDCMTKTPDIERHKKGCRYRLIAERDTTRIELGLVRAELGRERQQLKACHERLSDVIAAKDAEIAELKLKTSLDGYRAMGKQVADALDERDRMACQNKQLRSHVSTLEYQNAVLREALKTMLNSAQPHPMEHGCMYEAWEVGKKALSQSETTEQKETI